MFKTIIASINIIPKQYKFRFYFLLFLSLVSVAFETASISLFIPFISHLTGNGELDSIFFSKILDIIKSINFFGLGNFLKMSQLKYFPLLLFFFY